MLLFREFVDETEILTMYQQNEPVKKIVEKTKVSLSEMYKILKKYGIDANRHKKRHSVVHSMLAMGQDLDTIAHISNYSKRHLYNIKNGHKR